MEHSSNTTSFFRTLFWLLLIYIAPQSIAYLIVALANALSITDYQIKTHLFDVSLLSVLTFPVALLFLNAAAKVSSTRDFVDYFELTPLQWRQALICLAVTLCLYLAFEYVGDVFALPLEPFMIEAQQMTFQSAGSYLIVLLCVCVVAPILEELTFRGWLYRLVRQTRLKTVGAIVVPSLVFAAIHLQYEYGFTYFYLIVSGVFFGLIRYKTNSLSYAILAHAMINGLTFLDLHVL